MEQGYQSTILVEKRNGIRSAYVPDRGLRIYTEILYGKRVLCPIDTDEGIPPKERPGRVRLALEKEHYFTKDVVLPGEVVDFAFDLWADMLRSRVFIEQVAAAAEKAREDISRVMWREAVRAWSAANARQYQIYAHYLSALLDKTKCH